MATFLLTWNPDGPGWPDDEHAKAVEAAAAGRMLANRWSVALRKSGISVGDRAYLVRQRHERGIVARGSFTSGVYEEKHWDGSRRTTTYADIEFEQMLPLNDRLSVEDLKTSLPTVSWDRLQGSGVLLRPPADQLLDQLWNAHITDSPYRIPEELPDQTYEEGAVTRVLVNRYERDRAARAASIAYHGTTCRVCGFNFEAQYGELGRDFVHVHHIREISVLGPGYQVDPKRDLIPLCANCHAMAHRTTPAQTPSQLRRRLRSARSATRGPV
ncbi:HNH endonuclease [Asanoa sp. NPDC049518]|uniref:HNH endonuclease n=1 Tax=unclassified Asanoa TaxID=2685164 RepID=UPI0034296404